MDEIKDIVKKVITDISSQKAEEPRDIQRVWESSVGATEQQHSKISGFKDGVLFINIDSSARLYQFKLRQGKLLEQLQDQSTKIKKLVFKIGKVT